MNGLSSIARNVMILGVLAAVAAMPVSCSSLPGDGVVPPGNEQQLLLNAAGRPVGWSDETHGRGAIPGYDEVFTQGQVKRINITIAPDDWQAMQNDMTDILGPSGGLGDGPTSPGGMPGGGGEPGQIPLEMVPSQAFVICEGIQEGGSCSGSRGGVVVNGTCTRLSDGRLACFPQNMPDGGMPGGGMPGGGGVPQIDDMLADADGAGLDRVPRTPIYVPCTVAFEDRTWWYVGIRFKGNTSLAYAWQMGIGKLSFRFDFDEFEDEHPEIDNQRFFGFKRLSLGNNFSDESLLREKIAMDIFREAGVPAPRTAFYRVYVDHGEGPTYFGLYTMTEVPDKPMLRTLFGDDGGNLYKPEGAGATWVAFERDSFVKKTNKSEQDFSDVEAAIAALHGDRSDPAGWRAGLEATLNVDGFLRWLAVNTLIQKWDSYGQIPLNYYLCSDPADGGRLHWIPWDYNQTLKSAPEGEGYPAQLSLGLTEVDENWPLIRYLMDDPVYRAMYVSHVQDVIEGAFAVEATQERYLAEHDLIAPYVTGVEGEQPGYTFLFDSRQFDVELDGMFDHVVRRNEDALRFLDANSESE